jgi:hypothetical protein
MELPTFITNQSLIERLRLQETINDPYTGQVSPGEMEARSKLWPDRSRWLQLQLMWVIEEGNRRIEEYVFTGVPDFALTKMGANIPVAMVFEKAPDGSSHARIYSAHELVEERGAVLTVDEHLIADRGSHDSLAEYFEVLHTGKVDASVNMFDPGGYIRHSNGDAHIGHAALHLAFNKFYKEGGIKLRYCNKTDNGAMTALECYMPSGRPACAVYQRSDDGKKIHGARLYL